MILKMHQHYGDGWVWLDNIEKLEHHGLLGVGDQDGHFDSFAELSAAVAHTWGDSNTRSFETEVWPTWGGANGTDHDAEGDKLDGARMFGVRTVVARRRDGTAILGVVHTEAFLLGDNGDTIERL